MRVRCIYNFIGRDDKTGAITPGHHPKRHGIYTVVGEQGKYYQLSEFQHTHGYNKNRFVPVTTDDFTFEDIDEILKGIPQLVPVGVIKGSIWRKNENV